MNCYVTDAGLTRMLPGPYSVVFKQNSDKINLIQIAKMFCGRCLINLVIQFFFFFRLLKR